MTTILDQVLEAEKAAAAAVTDAESAAQAATVAADTAHTTAITAEKEALAAAEREAVAAYQSDLQKLKTDEAVKTEQAVAQVKAGFAKQHDSLVKIVTGYFG